jgi:hypothetical protein
MKMEEWSTGEMENQLFQFVLRSTTHETRGNTPALQYSLDPYEPKSSNSGMRKPSAYGRI